jgi:glucose uptake protein GlcU
MGGFDVLTNGVRLDIALPLSIGFIIGALILLFAKKEE